RKLNAGDYDGAAGEFMRWVSPGTEVEAGLRRRRQAERDLFLS
ncbi:lysozyme, partial [Salmonella enterica]|nr:lysozyme [Salmonella enterica]